MLKTKRLILRQWTEEDFHPFAEMCSDEDVMAHFPKPLSAEESHEMARKIQSLIRERGWGLWAIEVAGQHKFIGFVGLHEAPSAMPFSPCIEIGWRLSKEHWGKGYATEAAKDVLRFAFEELSLSHVVSFTTVENTRSRAVMHRIGLRDTDQNFAHPNIEPSHPQSEHVLYKITQSEWRQLNR
ncbi:GNAT family N-acetyltransferase [Enterovibrio coralii]|uniref:GCN5 family acetyltransferase n=1 Tax=Enterovibrio coralii TaxID=294935 RepID=A0A135I8Z4_9GAMM|nr:GNAT family N-acetyltransferase [Enterovibrio coralii]KXF81925.1 GCN5 family acetyltransferase [Enterovibrio coralii]